MTIPKVRLNLIVQSFKIKSTILAMSDGWHTKNGRNRFSIKSMIVETRRALIILQMKLDYN